MHHHVAGQHHQAVFIGGVKWDGGGGVISGHQCQCHRRGINPGRGPFVVVGSYHHRGVQRPMTHHRKVVMVTEPGLAIAGGVGLGQPQLGPGHRSSGVNVVFGVGNTPAGSHEVEFTGSHNLV